MGGSIGGAGLGAPPAETIAGALRAAASDGRPWLTFHRGESVRALSFAEAFSLARRWSAALLDAGVDAGDRVAVIQPNGADFAGAFFGAQLAGATPVPLSWPVVAAAGEKNHALLAAQVARADVAAVATQPDFAVDFGRPRVTAAAPFGAEGEPVAAGDSAFLQFTSGTTGAPRGAVISHRAAVASAHAMSLALDLGEHDVGVSWLPLFHDMGLVGVLLCSLLRRFPVHVMAPAEFLLRPARWLELLAKTKATMTVAPNFGYELAVRRVQRRLRPLGPAPRARRVGAGAPRHARRLRVAASPRGPAPCCRSTASPRTRSASRSPTTPRPRPTSPSRAARSRRWAGRCRGRRCR